MKKMVLNHTWSLEVGIKDLEQFGMFQKDFPFLPEKLKKVKGKREKRLQFETIYMKNFEWEKCITYP